VHESAQHHDADTECLLAQGIKDISVQSSVSLQHLPYNAELETQLPKDLQSRLAFAKQKVAEIAAAAKASPSSGVSLTAALPPVSESSEPDTRGYDMPA
jgi:5-methyltetrahydropteroyltriglutamate--homocysteine methyltransferase